LFQKANNVPDATILVLWEKGGGDTMKIRKDLIVVALATFCLTVTLFTALPTRSQSGMGEYDPWIDSNDDGIIDIFDAIHLAGAYGTEGTAINKTALLLELEARIDALNASLVELQSRNRFVVGQISGLPNLALDQPMPYLPGATGENTIVVASGVGNFTSSIKPLAVQAKVTSPTTIRFAVWDCNGVEYDPNDAAWNSIEINYAVIDR
jgi:hypothetical protein